MPAPTNVEVVQRPKYEPQDEDDIKVKILPRIAELPVIQEEDAPTYTLRRRKKMKDPIRAEEEDFDSVEQEPFSDYKNNTDDRVNGDNHGHPSSPYAASSSGSPEKADTERSLDLSDSTDNSGVPAFPDLTDSTFDSSALSQEIAPKNTSSPLMRQSPGSNGQPVILRDKKQLLSSEPLLGEDEVLRMRLFYQKLGSKIVVCESTADIYFGTVLDKIKGQVPKTGPEHTGIPVFVLHPCGDDSEFMKLKIIIAERSTGFALWHDDLERASDYSAMFPNFHCFFMSTDRSVLVGVLFHSKDAGLDFLSQYKRCAPTLPCGADTLRRQKRQAKQQPQSQTLDRTPKSATLDRKQKSSTLDRRGKVRNSTGSLQVKSDKKGQTTPKLKNKLRKDMISSPSGFTHVTKVQPNDQRLSVTFDELMDLDVSRLSDSFRDRLNTS